MAIKYEISAITGEYTNSNGETKKRYCKMGVVMDTKNGGLMMKVEQIPTNWDGFAYLNSPKEKDAVYPDPAPSAPVADDDIPF